jgi:hypothetical protein
MLMLLIHLLALHIEGMILIKYLNESNVSTIHPTIMQRPSFLTKLSSPVVAES